MPTYEYSCPRCLLLTEVTKPISALDHPEECPGENCVGQFMHRNMVAAQISTSNCQFDAHFNYGLGKVVKSKGEVKNELRRINGETGRDIVEVGNDRLQSIKKQRKEYTLD